MILNDHNRILIVSELIKKWSLFVVYAECLIAKYEYIFLITI